MRQIIFVIIKVVVDYYYLYCYSYCCSGRSCGYSNKRHFLKKISTVVLEQEQVWNYETNSICNNESSTCIATVTVLMVEVAAIVRRDSYFS